MTVHQPRCQLLPRDERQHDVGRVRAVVIDGVIGRDLAALLLERLAGVGVDVEAREVARRDVEAQAVAAFEKIGGWIERDRDLI